MTSHAIEAISEALQRIEAKVDASIKRSDERHEDTKRELRDLRSAIALLRDSDQAHKGAFANLETRIAALEGRVATIETENLLASRAWRDGDREQQDSLMSAMRLVQTQQETLREEFVAAQRDTVVALGSLVQSVANVKLPRWARFFVVAGFAVGTVVSGILAGLISHGIVRLP